MKAGSFSGIHDLNKEPVERLCRSNLPQSVHGKKVIQPVAAVDI